MALPAPNNNPAPTTNLATAEQELAPAYAQPIKEVNQQISQAGIAEQTALGQLMNNQKTTLSSLDQAKVNAFGTIGANANAKGLLFSGYAPAEQTAYTNTTYNPGVTKANTDFNTGVANEKTSYGQTLTSLRDKIAEINQERANAGQSLVTSTQNAQIEAAKEAASAANKTQSVTELTKYGGDAYNQVKTYLAGVTGSQGGKHAGDKYVSPESYGLAFQKWSQATGGSLSTFNKLFFTYKNPTNKAYSKFLP